MPEYPMDFGNGYKGQQEEPFLLSCPVCNEEGKPLYEVHYSIKTGWLEDFCDFDNACQREALKDLTAVYDNDEIFQSARKESDFSDLQILALVRDNVKVEWEAIGEGLHGDYDPRDPEDIELLRFYVSVLRDGEWMEKEDGSYCTNFPVDSTVDEKLAGLEILLDRYHDALSADIDVSVKKLGEEMSWISPDIAADNIKPLGFQAIACNGVPIFDGHGGIMTTDAANLLEETWEKSENYVCNHTSIAKKPSKVSLEQQIQNASSRLSDAASDHVQVHKAVPER